MGPQHEQMIGQQLQEQQPQEYNPTLGDPQKDESTKEININTGNIAKTLSEEQINGLSSKVEKGYKIDVISMEPWLSKMKVAIDVAMQVQKDKTYPWPKASNVKYPLLTVAAYQFNARSYPAILPGTRIAKARVVGADPQSEKANRAARVSEHMSWQLLEEMEEWEPDMDMLLTVLPIMGCMFKKTYYSASLRRQTSDLVFPQDFVVNYKAKSLARVPRMTHRIYLYPNEIHARVNQGVFLPTALDVLPTVEDDGQPDDEEAPILFLEQHMNYDLDGDGYAEPWIVTVDATNFNVLRVVPCYDEEEVERNGKGKITHIPRSTYFTKYSFLPAPDGGFYDIGFGALMGSISETVDRTINQLIDAGHLANVQGGFIGSGLKLKKGMNAIRPGEWAPINAPGGKIRDSIVPLPTKEPSMVLLQLLQFLIDAGKQISSVQDIMTGESKENETATTTMARLEQGMKLFTSILKRIHRSLKQEFKLIYILNSKYLDEEKYFNMLDSGDQQKIGIADYNLEDMDIVPVSDPNLTSDAHKIMRAEMLLKFMDDPEIDSWEVKRRYFEAAGIADIENLRNKQEPQPDPKIELEREKLKNTAAMNMARLQVERLNMEVKERETEAKINKLLADSLKLLAEAQATEPSKQIMELKRQLDTLVTEREAREEAKEFAEFQKEEAQQAQAQQEQMQQQNQQPQQMNGEMNEQQPNGRQHLAGGMEGMANAPTDEGISEIPQGEPSEY
jgi:chaperonin GroES